jgi:putative transposase
MAWKECSIMDERMKFIARLLDGERMTDLCREFGISRKTGYKIWNRYQKVGLKALTDRSRRPYRYANQIPLQLESFIVRCKRERPTWGAPKIRELVLKKFPDIKPPAKSTVHAVLDRHGLVTPRRERRYRAQGTVLQPALEPNDLWCTDFKGEFMLENRKYCYPLTITDQASRFLLGCEGLESTEQKPVFAIFQQVFEEHGLPAAIRSDNGNPFSCPRALFGLSQLSVWWLRLGIRIERIRPGHPEQNGRHERMHRTLKKDATKPASPNFLHQQARFDQFIEDYNQHRPHEALGMKCPSDVYRPSSRPYRGLPELAYPFHDRTVTVTRCGRICMDRRKVNFSTVFAGQDVGLKEDDEGIWLVSFMDYDLGYFDFEGMRFEPLPDPFRQQPVLPMSPV